MQAVMSESVIEEKKTPIIQKILVVLGMIILMGSTLTGVMTYLNLGNTETFFADWVTSFLTAAVTMMALLTKGAEKRLPNMATKARDALVGISMACIME